MYVMTIIHDIKSTNKAKMKSYLCKNKKCLYETQCYNAISYSSAIINCLSNKKQQAYEYLLKHVIIK